MVAGSGGEGTLGFGDVSVAVMDGAVKEREPRLQPSYTAVMHLRAARAYLKMAKVLKPYDADYCEMRAEKEIEEAVRDA